MRKIFFPLTLIFAFVLFYLWGYNAAAGNLNKEQQAGQPFPGADPSQTQQASQQNLLLLQADRFDVAQPVLESAWVLSNFQSANQTVLSFTQIYPDKKNQDLDRVFALDNQRVPTKKFLRTIERTGVQFDGYILIDAAGSSLVERWLRDQGIPFFTQDTTTPQMLLHSTCIYLSSPQSDQGSKFDWPSFDAHFETDIPFDSLFASWNQVLDPSRPIRCEVLEN